MHNQELHNLYSSPRIIRIIKEGEMGRACSMNGEKRNEYGVLVGKLEGKRSLVKIYVYFFSHIHYTESAINVYVQQVLARE
jgi:hypothetical protein